MNGRAPLRYASACQNGSLLFINLIIPSPQEQGLSNYTSVWRALSWLGANGSQMILWLNNGGWTFKYTLRPIRKRYSWKPFESVAMLHSIRIALTVAEMSTSFVVILRRPARGCHSLTYWPLHNKRRICRTWVMKIWCATRQTFQGIEKIKVVVTTITSHHKPWQSILYVLQESAACVHWRRREQRLLPMTLYGTMGLGWNADTVPCERYKTQFFSFWFVKKVWNIQ